METKDIIVKDEIMVANHIEKGFQLSQQYILDNRKNIVGISKDEVVLLDMYDCSSCRLIYIDLSDYKVKYVVYRKLGEC